jgi:hypothetical protein
MKQLFTLIIVLFAIAAGTVSAQLSATITHTNPGCGTSNGSATVNPAGGSNYSYKWSNGQTTSTINNLGVGTYNVTVYATVGGGTITYDTIYSENFSEANPPWTINIPTGSNDPYNNFWLINDSCGGKVSGDSCEGYLNGHKTLYISSYIANVPDADVLGQPVFSGASWETGTGAYGCNYAYYGFYCTTTNMAAQSANISTMNTHNLIVSYGFVGNGYLNTDIGSSYYSINGGTNFVTLDPSLRSTTAACPGANGEGTSGNRYWARRSYDLPQSALNISDFVLRFNWTNDNNAVGNDPSVAIEDIYVIDSTYTPGNGTTDSFVTSVNLVTPGAPALVTSGLAITNPTCAQSNGSVTGLSATGGSTPYASEVWKNSSNTVISSSYGFTNQPAGTYTFTLTDNSGCTVDTTITLVSTGSAPTPLIAADKDSICTNDTVQICVTDTTGNSYTGYAWNTGQSTACITNTNGGDYYLTVTSANGCTATSSHLSIVVLPSPSISTSQSGDTLTCYGSTNRQWYENGVAIPGATDTVYIATTPGIYTVETTSPNGCTAISNSISTAINNILPGVQFEIFPNPVTEGILELKNPSALIGAEYQIFDATGRLVYASKITGQQNEINIADYANGAYMFKIGNVMKKFVKEQ